MSEVDKSRGSSRASDKPAPLAATTWASSSFEGKTAALHLLNRPVNDDEMMQNHYICELAMTGITLTFELGGI